MKRLLAVALFCAVALSLAVPAFAVHLKNEDVMFRTYRDTYKTVAGYVDSTISKRVGAALTGFVHDTTAAISTEGWAHPTPSGVPATDTLNTYCTLVISDATGSSSGASCDSIHVEVQGSFSGVNWIPLGTFKGGTPATQVSQLDQTSVNGTMFGLASTGATLAWVKPYKVGLPTDAFKADVFGINRYPLLRWIVSFSYPDGYVVRAFVTHLED